MSVETNPPSAAGMPVGIGPDTVDAIAEATAAKIAQGLLRMPDELRAAVADSASGFFSNPGTLMHGPNAYYLQAHVRPGGIELVINRPDGSRCWAAVIVLCRAAIPTGTGPTPGRST